MESVKIIINFAPRGGEEEFLEGNLILGLIQAGNLSDFGPDCASVQN